jgi:ubiquinone/menaquinone biosynthesis C-methylase UbiE
MTKVAHDAVHNYMTLLIILTVIATIGLILYWQLVIAEGAYLGVRAVIWLYDLTAKKYNAIKEYEDEFEDIAIGEPLANRLYRQPEAMVLDVATGTGRVPLALLRQSFCQGQIIGLDRAARMLAIAVEDTRHSNQVSLIQADAMALPFADDSFPVVTCLEALEFLPDPEKGLRELVRVLAPATVEHPERGWLLTSNRIGWETWLLPGKTWQSKQLEEILNQLPLQYVDIRPWETIYDMVWAQKVGDNKLSR